MTDMWHENNRGELVRCPAKIKCRLGGEHFPGVTQADANKAREARLMESHGLSAQITTSKEPTPTKSLWIKHVGVVNFYEDKCQATGCDRPAHSGASCQDLDKYMRAGNETRELSITPSKEDHDFLVKKLHEDYMEKQARVRANIRKYGENAVRPTREKYQNLLNAVNDAEELKYPKKLNTYDNEDKVSEYYDKYPGLKDAKLGFDLVSSQYSLLQSRKDALSIAGLAEMNRINDPRDNSPAQKVNRVLNNLIDVPEFDDNPSKFIPIRIEDLNIEALTKLQDEATKKNIEAQKNVDRSANPHATETIDGPIIRRISKKDAAEYWGNNPDTLYVTVQKPDGKQMHIKTSSLDAETRFYKKNKDTALNVYLGFYDDPENAGKPLGSYYENVKDIRLTSSKTDRLIGTYKFLGLTRFADAKGEFATYK